MFADLALEETGTNVATIRAFSDDLITMAGPAFIVTDRLGNTGDPGYRGLFFADTRYLSHYEFLWNNTAPLLLRSEQTGYGETQIFATNTDLDAIPDQSLELVRRRQLGERFSEQIVLTNHLLESIELEISLALDVDFADIFEVRGYLAGHPPQRAIARVEEKQIDFSFRSSEQRWQTVIAFSRKPDILTSRLARFDIRLDAGMIWQLDVIVEWSSPKPHSTLPAPIVYRRQQRDELQGENRSVASSLQTDDQKLLLAYERSLADLRQLEFQLSNGASILAAGVPWYVAIFGRDAIISSLQILPIAPHIAEGTLRTLAAYQASDFDSFRDAEPGKIPHEIRFGPLAESNEIPHARYYGTADATPLWLILLAATYRWTGNRTLLEELLPAAERALHWIDHFGDRDGDGFVEYQTRSPLGLVNQGWKDSGNSIRFADGRLADLPIALVEVQGYAYAAKQAMADIYEVVDRSDEAALVRAQAIDLKQRVHDAFWMPEQQCYAMALDGTKQQVDGIGSNQGHLLWSGLPDYEFGNTIVDRLMRSDCYSGWGIRTLASSMVGFNPIGYHIGSVWPHDTALIAAGFRRFDRDTEARALIDGMVDATWWFDLQRLPELFGGHDRADTPFPVDCPVACSPQAWSAGSIVMILTELAGLHTGADGLQIHPIATGREFEWSGVCFRGNEYTIEVDPAGHGSISRHTKSG